jgi:hypothetical protein
VPSEAVTTAVAEDESTRAMMERLIARRDELAAQIERDRAEMARLQRAIMGLASLLESSDSSGTIDVIMGYVNGLRPGAQIDVTDLLEYAAAQGWLTSAVNRRMAIQTRLPKLVKLGLFTYRGRGKYYKLTKVEQQALDLMKQRDKH